MQPASWNQGFPSHSFVDKVSTMLLRLIQVYQFVFDLILYEIARKTSFVHLIGDWSDPGASTHFRHNCSLTSHLLFLDSYILYYSYIIYPLTTFWSPKDYEHWEIRNNASNIQLDNRGACLDSIAVPVFAVWLNLTNSIRMNTRRGALSRLACSSSSPHCSGNEMTPHPKKPQ